MKSYFILWGKRNLGNLLRKAGETMREYYNLACDVLDTARDIAADVSTSLDQALQAMEIAALMNIWKALKALEDTIEAK